MELREVSITLRKQQAELNKRLESAYANMLIVVALNSANSERRRLIKKLQSLGRNIGESIDAREAAVAAYTSSDNSTAFEVSLQHAVTALPSDEEVQTVLQEVDLILSMNQTDPVHETPSDGVKDKSPSKGPKPEPPKRLTADSLNEFDDVLREFTPAALRRALQIGQRADQLSQWADTRRWKPNSKESKGMFRDAQFSPWQLRGRTGENHPPSNMKGRSR